MSVVASNPFRFRDQLDFASNDSLHAAAQWITEAPCAQFACHMLLPQPAQLSLRHGLAVWQSGSLSRLLRLVLACKWRLGQSGD